MSLSIYTEIISNSASEKILPSVYQQHACAYTGNRSARRGFINPTINLTWITSYPYNQTPSPSIHTVCASSAIVDDYARPFAVPGRLVMHLAASRQDRRPAVLLPVLTFEYEQLAVDVVAQLTSDREEAAHTFVSNAVAHRCGGGKAGRLDMRRGGELGGRVECSIRCKMRARHSVECLMKAEVHQMLSQR